MIRDNFKDSAVRGRFKGKRRCIFDGSQAAEYISDELCDLHEYFCFIARELYER